MNSIYYIILIFAVVSYLLGLFLSHFEKKGKTNVLSQMGNAGFVNIYGINKPVPEYEDVYEPLPELVEEFKEEVQPIVKEVAHAEKTSYMDDEII